jgi:PTS system nitrogen regulatory IIA component
MTLSELIKPDRVFAGLRVADKPKLLAELGKRAATALGLPVAEVIASLAAREALGSTGVGAGIAVPHARLEGLRELAGFFAQLERPIDYAAIDGRPVDLVFLLLSPAQGPAAHLAALAAVSRRLRDASVAAAIRAGGSGPAIRGLLVGVG